MDFKGQPFGPMPALMATAEYVTKVHAVCTKTGNLAHFSHRTIPDDRLVLLGEVSEYEPLSRAAYYREIQKDREEKIKREEKIRREEEIEKAERKLKAEKNQKEQKITDSPNES